jgi:hypothetical protein
MTRRKMNDGRWLWIVPALVVACYAGSDADDGATPCLKDTDCKGDRLCYGGVCTPVDEVGPDSADPPEPCLKDTDCRGDRLCVDGYCEGPEEDSSGGGGADSSCAEIGGKIVCAQPSDPGPSMMEMGSQTVPPPDGQLPESASLDLGGFVVGDQGQCGSCTAFAVRNAMGLRAAEQEMFADFSPAHIWHIAGYGSADCTEGSPIWGVVSANDVQETEVVPASVWPYDSNDPKGSLDAVPPSGVLADGGLAYIDEFVGVDWHSAMQAKYAIAQGWPPVISVPVYWDDWDDADIDQLPGEDDIPDGYHAISLVGYDDATSRFRFVNSWGTDFGDDGFGTMSYAFVDQESRGGAAIQLLKYATSDPDPDPDPIACGDGACNGTETQDSCCKDCGCPGGFGCESNVCVEDAPCGNGKVDPGEDCDGGNLGGASCSSEGYDGGDLACSGCSFTFAGCCSDECSGGGDECLDDSTVWSCGDHDGDECLEYGGEQACPAGQVCEDGECGCGSGDEAQFEVVSGDYPNSWVTGCSGDGTLKLKGSAEMIDPTTLRVYARKADDSSFGTPATLSLYVGEPIQCPDPPNVIKKTKALSVGSPSSTSTCR